jgi:Immune Mapped Protein 2 (IMP2) N-terminal domain/Immune Mapped Protein 2 (IMP2) C-terminal domain
MATPGTDPDADYDDDDSYAAKAAAAVDGGGTTGAGAAIVDGTANLVKGCLSVLFGTNPKQQQNETISDDDVFDGIPPTSSLRGLQVPFFHETRDSFRARPEVMEDGCYLLYDNASGGTLVLHYSHRSVPENAVGFWKPGGDRTIQSWKYDRAGGYSELLRGIVGGTQNKRRYYGGWCQFVQMAKSMRGEIKIIDRDAKGDGDAHDEPTSTGQFLPIDLYGFTDDSKVRPLGKDYGFVDVSDVTAVACVPRHNDRFQGVKTMDELVFMQHGNLEGAALKLHL